MVQTATSEEVNKANIVINEDVDVTTQTALKGYRNIACFGVDSRDGTLESGYRSDSIIIVSINQETKDVKLLSVYRDTCMKVQGWGFTKATHAYAYGGAELAMSMLNTNLDLDITEFATVDFGVMADIIDAVGGIEIDLSDAEFSLINKLIDEQNRVTGSSSPHLSSSGYQLLNGTQATAYARIRKIDSDFKRAERQRIVLTKVFEKAKTADIGTLLNIIDTVLPEVYTNLTSTELIALAKDIFSYNIVDESGFPFEKTTGSLSDGLSYVFAEGMEANVRELHAYLFGNEEYIPSSTVTEISNDLYYQSGH
jgi:LCP family protein required for cell wall assembly